MIEIAAALIGGFIIGFAAGAYGVLRYFKHKQQKMQKELGEALGGNMEEMFGESE